MWTSHKAKLAWVGVGVCLVMAVIGLAPLKAGANNSIIVSQSGSGASIDTEVSGTTPLRLKACFSSVWREDTDSNPAGLDCLGETWNGQVWLSQTASWQQFTSYPIVNGRLQALLGVKLNDSMMPSFLYIIGLGEGLATSQRIKLPIHFDVLSETGDRKITVRKDDGLSHISGWLVVRSQAGTNWRLWSQELVVYTDLRFVSFAVQSSGNATSNDVKLYQFDQAGAYLVSLDSPPSHKYNPTIIGTPNIYVSVPHAFSLATNQAYLGQVEWYIDGQQVPGVSSQTITNLGLSPGRHLLGVKLVESNEWAYTNLQVAVANWLRFDTVLPVAQPGGREKIVIANSGIHETDLTGWHIVSETTKRKLVLSGRLAPGGQFLVESRGYLTNDGGVYSLVDPFSSVVDQLSYPAVPVEVVVARADNSIVWVSQPGSIEVDYVSIAGTVTNRRGKRVDVLTTQNAPIHLVVATDTFPSVRRGQSIELVRVERKTVLGRAEYRIIASTVIRLTTVPKPMPVSPQQMVQAELPPNTRLISTNQDYTPPGIRPPPPVSLVLNSPHSQFPLLLIALLLSIGVVLMAKHDHYSQNR